MKKTQLILAVIAMLCSVHMTARAQDAEKKSIPETAVAAGNFKTLVKAVKAAGLLEMLAGKGPFTVLAPTDEAFAKLPEGTVESLVKPENKDKLVAILKMHVASGNLTSDMAEPGAAIRTLGGKSLRVDVKGDTISVAGAKVIKADISCSNGVIHVIDSVILPETSLDPTALVGKWTYSKAVLNGTEKSADELEDQSVDITTKTWTLNGAEKFVMDYKLDTTASPNEIKFTITDGPFGVGSSSGGLIKMVGEQLVVCYSGTGGDAPQEFASKDGSGFNLFYLKKSK